MRSTHALGASALMFSAVVALRLDAQVQKQPTAVDNSAEVDTELEEIIIRGQQRPPWGELRAEIERAQEVVFARFNDINSTDDFDVICRGYRGSSYKDKTCLSRSARAFQNRLGTADALGNDGLVWLLILQAQARQRQLNDEMRQLTATDAQLRDAVLDLGQAQLAHDLSVGNRTLSRQVSANLGQLPYNAELLFEVIMGNDAWRHPLTQRTFTIADVSGEIRKLEFDCAGGNERVTYEMGVDWTLPSNLTNCVLQVNAKKGTTFRLYEF